jgi:ketosteroid isomerase-like protein
MAEQTQQDVRRRHDYVVAITRLFIEALNARDFESMRALVAEDVELRGPNGSSLRGYPAASELIEAASHVDLVIVRTALEEIEEDDGATRVTTPIRELIHREELFRTAVFRVRDGAIASYETLSND